MREKQLFFNITLILLILLSMIGGGEWLLRYRRQHVQKSNHIDANFIRYNQSLGWGLTPNWQGEHTHYDFTVKYSINRHGFRGGLSLSSEKSVPQYAVFGDSFTFGFGVNDDETFVHFLNMAHQPEKVFFNLAVPGYSTDQELLLLQTKPLHFNPTHLVIVVYLGNDLYDNQLSFPLQADNGKPYFELNTDGTELMLNNSPVPLLEKTAGQVWKDRQRVLGFWEDSSANRGIAHYLDKFLLFRMLKLQLYPYPDVSSELGAYHTYALQLFTAIIQEIYTLTHEKQMGLSIVLLPGQSFIRRPNSPDAQSQDFFRKKIVSTLSHSQIEVIDLAKLLSQRYSTEPGEWYYPNEGHLTPQGHRIVAEILGQHL
ncbi:MAG: SGNH/GDSL hydrolase family protein [bacterium]|nr:SGNH/GDSL hydrolase family protein [bacterium]